MFGTWMGIAVMTKRVPNETLALFVMFRMWMRVPELIERVPMKFLGFLERRCKVRSLIFEMWI